jgi:hypothetical protein
MSSPENNINRSALREHGRPRSDLSRSFVVWFVVAVGVCVVWTVAVVIWMSPTRLSTSQASSRAESVLTTMATLSGAAIVLAITAILIGLQLSSRFGSRASRTVITRPVAAFMGVAGILGVAVPLWAAAEPWHWLQTAGLASFAWTILALGVAVSRILAHLNPRWLAAHQVERLSRFLTPELQARRAQLREAQSVLLEIADGTPEGDVDGHAARRAITYVGLAGHRLTGNSEDLSELAETLGARARSAAHRGESPLASAQMLSLIGVVSGDSEVGISVLRQQSDLAQDAIGQRREPVVRALLDEAASFATDRLQTLLEPATIAWLAGQNPSQSAVGLHVVLPDQEESPTVGYAVPNHLHTDRRTVIAWIEDTTPPSRNDAETLAGLLPPAKDHRPVEHIETEVVNVAPTLVELEALGIGVASDPDGSPEVPEKPIVIAALSDYLAGVTAPNIPKSNASEDDHRSEAEWRATLAARNRRSDAYDVLEATVESLAAAVAAPNPDDHGWPGGWRGSGAFAADMSRLAAPGLSLYQSGRYPPTDKAEAVIEDLVTRLVRTQQPGSSDDSPADPIGWRVPETTLRPTAANEATTAMRELAIEAWRAGFARRALLTVRRLIAVFTAVAGRGDARRAEDLAENLRLAVIRTAQWRDDTIAERQRSRALVLALAPELSTLGRAVARIQDDTTWETVFGVLDTIGWSPHGSPAEAAAEVYLHFLAGFGTPPDEPYFGRPWDLVSWGNHPTSLATQLPDQARRRLRQELEMSGTLAEPRLALLTVLALWRDAIIMDTQESTEAFRGALQERILDHGRRDFETDELWDPAEIGKERPPRFDQPLVHWRVYDVALAASRWTEAPTRDDTAKPSLPPVVTPDSDLWGMIEKQGARSLVDERDYWGVEYNEDELVLVEEADRSRRLLRDCECRARSRINWGYGGSGPYDLASLLVADCLGPLAYCPSCFGTIGVAADLIQCPVCENGMRPGLWEMQSACNWLTSRLSRVPNQSLSSDDSPPSAQWHIRRTDLLDLLVRKAAEFAQDDDSEPSPDDTARETDEP